MTRIADDYTYLCHRHGVVKARVFGGPSHRGGCGPGCGWCGEDNLRSYQCPECGDECSRVADGLAAVDVVDHLRRRCRLHPSEVAALWAVLGSCSEDEEPAPDADERACDLLECVGALPSEAARDAMHSWMTREKEDRS